VARAYNIEEGRTWTHLGRTGLALLVAGLTASSAWADVLVAPDGSLQSVERHRALIVHQGRAQVLVEELHVDSRATRALWIKPLPVAPRYQDAPEAPFSVLEENTDVPEPYNEAVRRRVFGPSVVTLLSERLLRDDTPPPQETKPPQRALKIIDSSLFTGTVYTSTITLKYVLPPEMQDWLRLRGFELPQPVVADLAAHLNRGAHVSLSLVEDTAPGSPGLARLGPVRSTMATPQPVLPILRRTDRGFRETLYEVFVVGGQPLVPSAYSTLWDEEPWVPRAVERGQFHTVFALPLEETSPLLLDLEQRQGIAVPAQPFLIRSSFHQGNEALGEILFEPAKYVVEIPGGGRRGDLLDLFLCILLGLTPLIYTPESWFLLWLAARAREARKRGEAGFGLKLWPLYALAVAIFWVATLHGAARLAAALPFLVAMGMLTLPATLRPDTRVRVDFSKKKKKAKK